MDNVEHSLPLLTIEKVVSFSVSLFLFSPLFWTPAYPSPSSSATLSRCQEEAEKGEALGRD